MRPMPPARTHDITRVEAFSDAVFAFALTLLVVSLEVPRDYSQLMLLMNGFLPFACCFAMLVWIWHEHNMYFRRYGLNDGYTVFLNAVLLFVVLFYVYPLKFMFDSMFAQFIPVLRVNVARMTFGELANASRIYALGFIVLFLLFALLYRHAYRKRAVLELTPLEVFDVKSFTTHHLLSASVGAVAFVAAVALPAERSFLSPMSFGLMGPVHWAYGSYTGRRRTVLERELVADAALSA
jgi:uncharacterized membrane protein